MSTTKLQQALFNNDLTPSKKSPFRLLIEQASTLGIRRIAFEVNTTDYTEDETMRWEAWSADVEECKTFYGTNGQHALTELIAAKRAELTANPRIG
jgi:hypothetical protein